MQYRNYSEEQFIEAVRVSLSVSDVCRKLNLVPIGGNFRTVSKYIVLLNLDTSHFTGRAWNKGRYKPTTQLTSATGLKIALIREKGHICWCCKNTTWNDKPIPLQIDHINGNPLDHQIDNLQILCANCHAQTDTYCSKNRVTELPPTGVEPVRPLQSVPFKGTVATVTPRGLIKRKRQPKDCLDCGIPIAYVSTKCKSCAAKGRKSKIIWPTITELRRMLSKSNYIRVARKLGVTDNAIRKHIKHHK